MLEIRRDDQVVVGGSFSGTLDTDRAGESAVYSDISNNFTTVPAPSGGTAKDFNQ